MLVVILFTNYGPYHTARIKACQKLFKSLGWDTLGLEISRSDKLYSWKKVCSNGNKK